jgi:hypothetical protein
MQLRYVHKTLWQILIFKKQHFNKILYSLVLEVNNPARHYYANNLLTPFFWPEKKHIFNKCCNFHFRQIYIKNTTFGGSKIF